MRDGGKEWGRVGEGEEWDGAETEDFIRSEVWIGRHDAIATTVGKHLNVFGVGGNGANAMRERGT